MAARYALMDAFSTRDRTVSFSATASADIDSDGRDEALFVMADSLYCIGSRADGKSGAMEWQLSLPCSVGPPTIADVDGDGLVEILLAGTDGYVYCVRGQ